MPLNISRLYQQIFTMLRSKTTILTAWANSNLPQQSLLKLEAKNVNAAHLEPIQSLAGGKVLPCRTKVLAAKARLGCKTLNSLLDSKSIKSIKHSAASQLKQVFSRAFSQLGHLTRILLISLSCLLLLNACEHKPDETWRLMQVERHLPALNFSLTSDQNKPVTANDYRGYFVLVYFGYTHCPDVCPETMARLMQTLNKLGNDAQRVRILFISVDPARDTPHSMHTYLNAFDAQHIVGLTGTPEQIEALARTYRVAYEADRADTHENYEVMHSSAIYIFGPQGRARLMATGSDSAENIAHDLRLLIQNCRFSANAKESLQDPSGKECLCC